MKKKIKRWFIKLLSDKFGADIQAYWSETETQQHWYKARRAGYKKSEMGFYYADIADSGDSDLGRYLF
ncbi:MAG TPA: hypothetical protein VFF49_11205 [Thermodesulfobacteriota bacterium]|nr:hypothetical protein [Thermodesulfobacteriota bacterium]